MALPAIALTEIMPSVSSTGVWAVMFAALLPVCILLRAFWVFIQANYRSGGVRPASPNEIPAHQLVILEQADTELQALGFRFWATIYSEGQTGTEDARYWLVYKHAELPAIARAGLSHDASRLAECDVFFSSWRKTDGKYLDTHPRGLSKVMPLPADALADGAVFSSLAEQSKFHQKRMQPMLGDLEFPDPNAWLARMDGLASMECERLAKLGYLRKGRENGTYWMRVPAAWRMAIEALLSQTKGLLKWKKPIIRQSGAKVSPEVLAELDLDEWRRAQERRTSSGGMKAWGKAAMLVISMALSAWALKDDRLDYKGVLAILSVLMIHELGHFLAMWMLGYRNLNILFIPFLGAVATSAKRPEVAPWKEVLVVLAGPLPGLITGCAALHYGCWGHEWLRGPVYFCIALNAMNLLPVLPMDGGHLFKLAVQARRPLLQAAFHVVSAVGMIVLGAFVGKVVLFLGIFQLMRSAVPWFVARVVRREHRAFQPLNGSHEPHDAEAAHRQALRAVWSHPRYRTKSGVIRQSIAAQIADQLRARPAGILSSSLALVACTSLVWAPAIAWVGFATQAEKMIAHQSQANAEAAVPKTAEEAVQSAAAKRDPAHQRRWSALQSIVCAVQENSPVLKAIDELNAQDQAEAGIEFKKRMAARKAGAVSSETDPLIAKREMLDLTNRTLPEDLREPIARFVEDVRKALVSDAQLGSEEAEPKAEDCLIDPLQLLRRSARRHLKAGRIFEWQADVLACARGVECAPWATIAECQVRAAATEQLLGVVEEGWPQLAAQQAVTLAEELLKRLPCPDDLMRRQALTVFTQARSNADDSMSAAIEQTESGVMSMLGAWMKNSPLAKLQLAEKLEKRRRLWEAVSGTQIPDWKSLCAGSDGMVSVLGGVSSPEVSAMVALRYAWLGQQARLRPDWQLFVTAVQMQKAGTAVRAVFGANCSQEKLSDGSDALVIKPAAHERPEGILIDSLTPQPVVWRLPRP